MTNAAVRIAHIAVQNGAAQKTGELAQLIELVCEFDPAVILEVGSMDGGTLRAWQAIAPEALLISVSLTQGPFGGGRVPEGLADHHVDADSHDPLTLGQVKDILDGRDVDFLFIDADHTYEGVKQDFEMYSPLVRLGGIVALHDILFNEEHSGIAVKRYWQELIDRYAWDEFVLPDHLRDGQPWGGIGVVYL